jgi:hypothetical protein
VFGGVLVLLVLHGGDGSCIHYTSEASGLGNIATTREGFLLPGGSFRLKPSLLLGRFLLSLLVLRTNHRPLGRRKSLQSRRARQRLEVIRVPQKLRRRMELILELLLLSGVARTLEVLSGRSSLLRVEEINLAIMVLVSVVGFDCQTGRSTVLHNRVTQVHLLPGPNAIIVIEGL